MRQYSSHFVHIYEVGVSEIESHLNQLELLFGITLDFIREECTESDSSDTMLVFKNKNPDQRYTLFVHV